MAAKATKKSRSPKPKCRECGSTKGVQLGMCEECEQDFVWCECCEDWLSREGDTCRHLVWTEWGWGGAGGYEGDWDNFKWEFLAFLDMLTEIENLSLDDYSDLITGIESEIAKDAFWTQLEGFILSTPTLYFYRLRPDLHRDRDGSVTALSFARITPDEIPRDDGEVADGFAWLQTLCADDTKDANRRTLEWIAEWRSLAAKGWRGGRRF